MKKFLAAAIVLVATATAMFAEASVGIHGILGVGSSNIGTFSASSAGKSLLRLANYDSGGPFNDFAVDGGFGLSARVGGAFGGKNKFLIGFQPELNFVFGRKDKRTRSVNAGLMDAEITFTTSYNTLNIPLLLYLGGRFDKFEFAFPGGPELVFPLSSKPKTKVDAEASVLNAAGVSGTKEAEIFKLGGIGIGYTGGIDFGYNITEHHGVSLGYRFSVGIINPFGGLIDDKSDVFYIDAANFSLGYRYKF